jgi:hypothetical protein
MRSRLAHRLTCPSWPVLPPAPRTISSASGRWNVRARVISSASATMNRSWPSNPRSSSSIDEMTWTDTMTGPIAISSPGSTCARWIGAPFFLVPLVLSRSSTQMPWSSQINRACWRDSPGSGISTSAGAARPTTSGRVLSSCATLAPSR